MTKKEKEKLVTLTTRDLSLEMFLKGNPYKEEGLTASSSDPRNEIHPPPAVKARSSPPLSDELLE